MIEKSALETAKDNLRNNNTCVAVRKNGCMAVSQGRGLAPMLLWLQKENDFLRGAVVADKIVGRASAFIMIHGGVKEVYAEVLSRGALELFRESGIHCEYSTLTDYIINRNGDGMCPMEKLVDSQRDAGMAYDMLYNKLLNK